MTLACGLSASGTESLKFFSRHNGIEYSHIALDVPSSGAKSPGSRQYGTTYTFQYSLRADD